jgi:HD superfamily phosphohydrolase
MHNKLKIINDPVYGFIKIPGDFIYDIVEHPVIQRLRRVKQLGLSHLVYPGAVHSRFQHVLGALHLMTLAVQELRSKEVEISDEEAEAVYLAILLHDAGHAPFSHSLEFQFVKNVPHEALSLHFMEKLNQEFPGKLDLCILIFKNSYHKKFLHQLVSSQLDMDRLDYLRRDSFYTGVVEGAIGSDRIIKMLDVQNGELAIESKGIYSIEKFLIARRLMYWQVYLHKTVVAAELQLLHIIKRAAHLVNRGSDIYIPEILKPFMMGKINSLSDLEQEYSFCGRVFSASELYLLLDDTEIVSAIKHWAYHEDKILSFLSKNILSRKLMRVRIFDSLPEDIHILENNISKCLKVKFGFDDVDIPFIHSHGTISNKAYKMTDERIIIKYKDSSAKDITEASDISNLSALSRTITKYYLFYPKECDAH